MRAARARLHSLNRRKNGSGAGPASVVGFRLRGLHVPEYLSLTRLSRPTRFILGSSRNWLRCVYEDGVVEEVLIAPGYPPGLSL